MELADILKRTWKHIVTFTAAAGFVLSASSCAQINSAVKEYKLKHYTQSGLQKAIKKNDVYYLGPKEKGCEVVFALIDGKAFYIEDGCCDPIDDNKDCVVDGIEDTCIVSQEDRTIIRTFDSMTSEEECGGFYKNIRDRVADEYIKRFRKLVYNNPEQLRIDQKGEYLKIEIDSPDNNEQYLLVDYNWNKTADIFIAETTGSDGIMRTSLRIGKDSPAEIQEKIDDLVMYVLANCRRR